MKFAFIPKANYTIGQIIEVHGKPMRVERYAHTGKNVVVHTLENAPRFERIVCICTDAPEIAERTSAMINKDTKGFSLLVQGE